MNPVIIPRAEHSISRKLIDPDALKVMYRLLKAGYHAYLVGGGVRDLLLGREPKDFDIGTDAHPNQIKKLFRNCRLVGRRFRLAHVHFGDKIIEVSTFRRRAEFEEMGDGDRLIRSDNTFGTPEEDSVRRDFTINGLFYELESFSVIDFVGGIEDLNRRMIRSIGDPDERIPEDPVRIIRAIKFAARLDFEIDDELWDSMVRFAPDIHKCAKARVLEEIYRLLRGGAATASFQLMQECGLMEELLPDLGRYLDAERDAGRDGEKVFWLYLNALDSLRSEGAELSNPILLGALTAHLTGVALGRGAEGRDGDSAAEEISPGELTKHVDRLTRDWVARLGVARRDRERLAHMLRSQPRFTKPRGRRFRPRSFVTKHYYPDAEALFALGVRATGLELETLERWREVGSQIGDREPREGRSGSAGSGRGRRGRRRRKPAGEKSTPSRDQERSGDEKSASARGRRGSGDEKSKSSRDRVRSGDEKSASARGRRGSGDEKAKAVSSGDSDDSGKRTHGRPRRRRRRR